VPTARSPGAPDLDYIQAGDLPYLTACPLYDRRIVLASLHDGSRFHVYIQQADRSLMVVQPIDMASGTYVARAPARPSDLRDQLAETVFQHFSYPRVLKLQESIHADTTNALASLHHYFILLWYAIRYSDMSDTRLVVTHLEYAFANHRAFYDLIAEVIALFRPEPLYSAATLPSSFRKMAEKSDEELRQKFGVPETLCSFIRSCQTAFLAVRAIRDNILHRGQNVVELVFKFQDGFGISADSALLAQLKHLVTWPDDLLRNGSIASLLPIFEFLARDLLTCASVLGETLRDLPNAPDGIAEGYHMYFRSPVGLHVGNFDLYRSTHWVRPETVLPVESDAV
jgi:hypothetical protein